MGYEINSKDSLKMANHKSALKRIRQSNARRLHNRYYAKTARNAVKNLRATENKEEARTLYPKVSSLLDKLAKRNIIHKNKAANLKSKLAKHVNALT
jgi:small subunit ribosomal protein S20